MNEEFTMSDIIEAVIQKGAGKNILLSGKKQRGPLATSDFIYECMVGVALELTDRLPMMFDAEQKKYGEQQELFRQLGNKGKYTDSYGWSKNHDMKFDFSLSPVFHHYFNRIIVPFLGGEKKGWDDENSKIWKRIKKMIIRNDKLEVTKLQKEIRNQILKESSKKIGASFGTNDKESQPSKIIKPGSI